jgi:S1-C subfamily serine protease
MRMIALRLPLVVVLAIGAFALQPWATQAQVPADAIEHVIARTVYIVVAIRQDEGRLRQVGGCSGSFITPNGYILTASHCVRATEDVANVGLRKGELHNPDGLVPVGLNLPGYVNPVPMMVAKFVADSVPLDLALIKVDRLLGSGGTRPIPPDFTVPYLKLADSDTVRHGEPIAVVGFPGVGGESVSVNQGNVSGFLADDSNRKRWLKIDATGAGPGSSGGPVVNSAGEQIGVISHGNVDARQASRSVRAALTNSIPVAWRQSARIVGLGPPTGATAGPGTQPGTPTPAPTPGAGPRQPSQETLAVLRGRVIDAGNGAPIAGAGIFVFKPGIDPRSASREDILAGAVTDGTGLFQTRPPIRRGASYPVAILANGYPPLLATLELPPTGADVAALGVIELER